MQRLALQLEQSRARLQYIMLDDPVALPLLAEHFLSNLDKNIEPSDLIKYKVNSECPGQSGGSSQHELEIIATAMRAALTASNQTPAELQHLHFMPAFLLQVAEKAIAACGHDIPNRQELMQLRHSLSATRHQMVIKNRKLVAFIARKQATGNVAFSDVMQEGMIGLLKAIDRFDHRRDVRFSTYAGYWIKQTVCRLVIRQDKIVRLPFGLAEKAPTVLEVMRSYYLNEDRWPTVGEITERCELSEEDIKTIVRYYQAAAPQSAPDESDDGEYDLLANLEQQTFRQPLEELTKQSLNRFLLEAIDSLPQREADILTLRFGLKQHQETTLQNVAEQMQVTRERIRQLQNKALERLRLNFGFELKPYLKTTDNS